MFKSLFLLYKGRHIPVGRLLFRRTLVKGWRQKSPEILLPPFIPIHELRIMLRVDYDTCFRACNVAIGEKNYYWKDKEGRQFQSSSKRSVILPFELAAYASSSFGYKPIMVNPEPTWENILSKKTIPVGVLVGHANHGKSTLFDKLANTQYSQIEPITQQMRSICIDNKLTLIDTPGHELFEILRGRCIHLADFALVVISLESGGEIQTRDVIIQADSFRVPIIFVLTKLDLSHSDPALTISELRNQLLEMHSQGIISRDYSDEANAAISVSSLTGLNIDKLQNQIFERLENLKVPFNPIRPTSMGGESIKKYLSFIRKSDVLVGANSSPSSVGLIVDVEKSHDRGILLSVIIRHGYIVRGNHFVAGTAYGRIKRIYLDGQEVESATVGHCVQIQGLKPYGNATTDDLIMTLPIHYAFRLSQYRMNVSSLRESQKSGIPLPIPYGINSNTTNEMHLEDPNEDVKGIEGEVIDGVEGEVINEVINEQATNEQATNESKFSEHSSILLEPGLREDRELVYGRRSKTPRYLKRDWFNTLDDYETKIARSNRLVLERWDSRVEQRENEYKRQEMNKRVLLLEAEQLRRRVLGEPQLDSSEIERFIMDNEKLDDSNKSRVYDKRLVVSVIMRTSFVGSLDMLMEGFERIENEFGVRIPLVHGGIGPIGPTDVIHAEIENRLTKDVPIYAFQVPVLPDAAKHAILNRVTIIKFDLFSDLLNHLRDRCITRLKSVGCKINFS